MRHFERPVSGDLRPVHSLRRPQGLHRGDADSMPTPAATERGVPGLLWDVPTLHNHHHYPHARAHHPAANKAPQARAKSLRIHRKVGHHSQRRNRMRAGIIWIEMWTWHLRCGWHAYKVEFSSPCWFRNCEPREVASNQIMWIGEKIIDLHGGQINDTSMTPEKIVSSRHRNTFPFRSSSNS